MAILSILCILLANPSQGMPCTHCYPKVEVPVVWSPSVNAHGEK